MRNTCQFCGEKLNQRKRFCSLKCCYDWQRKHGWFAAGREVSRETRKRISQGLLNLGEKHPAKSKAFRKNLSNKLKGKKKTKQHRMNISKGLKGKKKSLAHRKALSLVHKGKKYPERSKERMGKGNPNFKGGKCLAPHGYISILMPNHPFCNSKRRVLEHRIVMEKHLGQYLDANEMVHHIDFDKQNNKIENLYLTTLKHNSSLNKQVHKLMKDLIKKGIVKFDRKKGKYYL